MNFAFLILALLYPPPPPIVIPIRPMPGVAHVDVFSATDLRGPWLNRDADVIVINQTATNCDWILHPTPGESQEFLKIVNADL